MKITAVETIHLLLPETAPYPGSELRDALLIRVHTDEGLVGLGTTDSEPSVATAIIGAPTIGGIVRGLRAVVLGQDPFDVQVLWQRMVAATAWYGRSGAAMQAIGGVDMALWDLMAQAAGRPLHKLLGGAFRKRVRAYATDIMPATPQEAHDVVAQHLGEGFTAVKLGWGPLGAVSPALDVALVAAAREAAGERDLMLDLGARWDAPQAIGMAQLLVPFHLFWLEEPLAPDDLTGYARLAAATTLRIAAGERETTYRGLVALAEQGHIGVLQPDLSLAGGLTPCLRVAQYAFDHHLLCVPHAYATDVLLAASLHFVAAMPHGHLVEVRINESPLVRDLLTEPFGLEADGTLRVPQAPGLGITLDEEVVRHYAQGPVLPLPGRQV